MDTKKITTNESGNDAKGDIDEANGNAINKAIDISEGIITDREVLIPE